MYTSFARLFFLLNARPFTILKAQDVPKLNIIHTRQEFGVGCYNIYLLHILDLTVRQISSSDIYSFGAGFTRRRVLWHVGSH